jgi:hypothetical protein
MKNSGVETEKDSSDEEFIVNAPNMHDIIILSVEPNGLSTNLILATSHAPKKLGLLRNFELCDKVKLYSSRVRTQNLRHLLT